MTFIHPENHTTDQPTVGLNELLHILSHQQHTFEAISAWSDNQWQGMVRHAVSHDLLPWVEYQLRGNVTPPDWIKLSLQKAARQSTIVNLHRYSEWQRINEAMITEGIELIPLKGLHLAAHIYPHIGLRTMRDIDVLVKPPQLASAAALLKRLDYVEEATGYMADKHLPPLIGPQGGRLELHHHITERDAPFAIDMVDIWNRAEKIILSGTETLVMRPEDLLLHLCLHATFEHRLELGLKLFVDILVLLKKEGHRLNWQTLIKQAHDWQATRCLFLGLSLAADLCNVPIPTNILNQLEPPKNITPIYNVAKTLTLKQPQEKLVTSRNMINLSNTTQWPEKLKILWQAILPSKQQLAVIYSIPKNSWQLYFYYGVRWWDISKRYSRILWAVVRKDTSVTKYLATEYDLMNWLSGKG